jgi:O-antigen ligase
LSHTAAEDYSRPINAPVAALRLLGTGLLASGVFLSGFVISEPAPYELLMVAIVAIWFILGLPISRPVSVLLALLLAFNVGGFFSLTQMYTIGEGPLYLAVSTFLALTSVFYAAVVEDRPNLLPVIFNAWLAAALITGSLGILGYFHAFPGAEVFTLYDRAKGAFQDPNVFGPFLVAPALYLLHGILSGKIMHMPLRICALLVLTLAVFLSFSRAAWGLYLICTVLLVFLMLLKERSSAFRLKILVLSVIAFTLFAIALLIALQFDKVADIFSDRTALVQSYDGGPFGRFARHRMGFLSAIEQPLGIGPMVFSTIYPEGEHNIWLKALTTHGWFGFVVYVALMLATLWGGFKLLLRNRPWQPFLLICWVTFVGHLVIGSVIDTDHWRHFFMLLGLIWGCMALEYRHWRKSAQSTAV